MSRSSLHRPSPEGAAAPPAEAPLPFSEYLTSSDPDKRQRAENWRFAIGLQRVDGLSGKRVRNPLGVRPAFYSSVGSFTVTLPNLNGPRKAAIGGTDGLADAGGVGNPVGNVGNRVGNVGNRVPGETDLEHLILECLRGDAKMSAAKIAKRAKVTTRTIERVFVRLRTSGRILRKGGTRGSWEVRD